MHTVVPGIVALAVVLSSIVQTQAVSAQPADPRAAAQGRAIVDKQCGRCHQTGVTGASRLPIAPPFRELMERYPPEALEEALGEGLASGHPTMPEFVFNPDEISAIVAYFASLRAPQ
jgi:cytochrome c